jgi:hypothetical protein
MLNDMSSFDYNWFVNYKDIDKKMTINDVYALYKQSSDPGNNIPLMKTGSTRPDGMIEHVFERIWLNVIKELNGSYLIVDNINVIEKYNIKINIGRCHIYV